jgi:hypothetical protein
MIFTTYIKDKNSSSSREFVTVSIAGYNHNSNKLGYNGFKQNTSIGGKPINCEAKPKNIQTEGYENRKSKLKLNGESAFGDYTTKRLEKDSLENLNILSSGFIDGELQYIFEFPFSAIKERLKTALEKLVGPYLRSATFNFSHYQHCKDLRIIYCNRDSIIRNKKYFTRNLFDFLITE